MPVCETCGNEYDKAMTIRVGSEEHVFDSFECAIEGVAPRCPHCNCRLIGHGVESDGRIYCCAHCAEESGERGISDRADR